MDPLYIENKHLDYKEIKDCFETIENEILKNEHVGIITIIAKQLVETIDPLFFAYLILFKHKYKEMMFFIDFPFNSEADNLFFELRHQFVYFYLVTGEESFSFKYGDQIIAIIKDDAFISNSFTVSKRIFPIFFIDNNKEQFDFLFTTSLKDLIRVIDDSDISALDPKIAWNKNSKKTKANYSLHYKSISSPIAKTDALINLARMQFVSALDSVKIAQFYFESRYNIKDYNQDNLISAGYLRNQDAFEYYNSIKFIFEELYNSSFLHQFVFSSILSTEMLEDELKRENRLSTENEQVYINKIKGLWNFTNNLCTGIKELAKNIREHSKNEDGSLSGLGAITLRLFDVEKWYNLKNTEELYRFYKGSLNKEIKSIIDINVIDLGRIGVTQSLIGNLEEILIEINETSPKLKQLISNDLFELNNGLIGFENLLDTGKKQLYHQSKRSIAHFGLLILSRLVEVNKGLVTASSIKNGTTKTREVAVYPNIYQSHKNMIEIGTNYSITIPVTPSKIYDTFLSRKYRFPTETTAKDLKGIEELLNYQILRKKRISNIKEEGKFLLLISFEDISLYNKDVEINFWELVIDQIDKLLIDEKGNKCVICLDLENVILDESQLFRTLGKYELSYPNIPLILVNVTDKLFANLLELNKLFISNSNLKIERVPFWNEDIATLVYSKKDFNGKMFYFTDILWGKTYEDFIKINWLANQASFNSTSCLLSESEGFTDMIDDNIEAIDPNTPLLFYNQKYPLPFDLILKNPRGSTFFESNIAILLRNNLLPVYHE